MAKENLNVNGELEQCTVVPMVGDGACLFRALSFLMYGTQDHAMQVRSEIVKYVVNDWTKFSVMSHDRNGDNYPTAIEYSADMIKNECYGGLCELIAAGLIFPFRFEVYRNGLLYTEAGSNDCPVRRLRFSQDLSNGHFDAYLPIVAKKIIQRRMEVPTGECHRLSDTSTIHSERGLSCKEIPVLERENLPVTSSVHSVILTEISVSQSSETNESAASSLAIKKKGKKRRARYTNDTRKKQIQTAQKKYRQDKPESHRKAASKYQRKNPDVHKKAVAAYQALNPEVHRQAVAVYQAVNPEVHRQAVAVYQAVNPEVHRQAVAVYQAKNPEVHREAVALYQSENPEVHRQAVAQYQSANPDVHRQAVADYQAVNPEVHREAVALYQAANPQVHRAIQTRYRKNTTLRLWRSKELSGMAYDPDIAYRTDSCVALGCMTYKCQWCNALKWKDETLGMCCSAGKVQLECLKQLPEPLHSLINDLHPDHVHFMNNIRKYNACFQMTSFGGKQITSDGFSPTFKVQGQVYHLIGSILPELGQDAQYLQIYFVGEDEREAKIRCSKFPNLKTNLIKQLQNMLHQVNPYIKDLKSAIDKIPPSQSFKVVIHADKKPPEEHRGRYNAPTANEVALVLVDQQFDRRDIILESRSNSLQRISEIHRAYDPLQYPLMFCWGNDGYSINIPQRDPTTKLPLNKTVSAASFYSYRIMIREGEDNYLVNYRALFSQYLVDEYAKIETERLNYIRKNQAKLRADSYIHLKDAIGRQDTEANQLGQMVVLPSSFTGARRYMHEKTQDAMTYVRHYGRPDLFITFTCNPRWNEIKENLLSGQKSHDRHDIISRVFRLKVKKIMNLLTKGKIFGEVRCYMYSTEWQKRGLPHIHILLWLQRRITPNQIDNIICAEIPDPKRDPELYEIVKCNMIHGPCGNINRNSPCMKNNVCSKHYPKALIKETQTGDDGYPQYKRHSPDDGGFSVDIKGVEIDNRWVVPYNPVLLRIFNAHVNVEYCHSIKSIKYVCKYVNKGSDQASFALENEKDEVKAYTSGRYISSSEAVWRILEFPIHERFPPVVHLAVHLENGQRVYFNEQNLCDKLNSPPTTTLLSFFDLCKVDDFAKTLLYPELPAYYVWNKRKFQRRKRGENVESWPGVKKEHALGRVYTVHPNNTECYHLRMLLHEIRGPISFEALKTVDGHLHPTFKSACKALGLLEDDQHLDTALEEAALCQSSHMIRDLFTIILVFCQVSDPLSLWEKFKEYLSEDFKKQLERQGDVDAEHIPDVVFNKCLSVLEDSVLALGGRPLKEYGLPQPNKPEQFGNREYLKETSYDLAALEDTIINNEVSLNDEQKLVYNQIITSVETNEGRIFFLDAPGGTGKTFLINLILAKVRRTRGIALAVASSGIAATLLEGGRTAHATFKLPLNLTMAETPICNISKQSDFAEVLKITKIIVWDEITMAHKGGVEALNRSLQDIRGNKKLMGGVTVLLAGDFRQTLPVVPRGTRADEVKSCIKRSNLWPQVTILKLSINMRVHLGGEESAGRFADLLLEIGNGDYPTFDGMITIPENLCTVVTTVQELISKVYPDIVHIHDKPIEWLCERAILTPKNDQAAAINDTLLMSFEGEEMVYTSIDTVVDPDDATNYPVEFLNSLKPPGLPYYKLILRVGTPIMLLRNLKPPKLCNGTRLKVKALHRNIVEATILTGCAQGETVFVPRIPLIPNDLPFEFKRLQFPLKVCFAMTINKSQGQTLKFAGIDLRENCFSHGQFYVACSRVSSPSSLVVLGPTNKLIKNIVYKEVL